MFSRFLLSNHHGGGVNKMFIGFFSGHPRSATKRASPSKKWDLIKRLLTARIPFFCLNKALFPGMNGIGGGHPETFIRDLVSIAFVLSKS